MGSPHVFRRDLAEVGLQGGSDTPSIHQFADFG